MRDQLIRHGLRYELVVAVKAAPPYVGTALSHLKILRMAELTVPFGILEDDCQFMDSFRYRVELPAAADALYLGVSCYGIRTPGSVSWGEWDHTKYMRFNHGFLRPFNMLEAHAIVYLSERYRRSAISVSLDVLTHPQVPYPGDVGAAMLQTSHLVLTPNEPFCYQSERHHGNHDATKYPLRRIAV